MVDLFEDLSRSSSIFEDEEKIDNNYYPDKFIARDRELALLFHLFMPLINNPNSIWIDKTL